MAAAEAKFSIKELFIIVNDALYPFYSNNKVTVEQEVEEGKEERMEVGQMEFIMRAIGHALEDRWASEEEVLPAMHAALDPREYDDFAFTIDKPTGLITYKFGARGGRRKSRKSKNK